MTIETLLPHAAPMILIDRVVSHDAQGGIAEVTVRPDHPFAQAEGVPAHLGIEFMAQACGALKGVWAQERGEPVQIGFLLGTRHFRAEQTFFPLGLKISIAVTLVVDGAEMGVFDCRLLDGDKLLAEAQLNVYQPGSAEAARAILTRD